jgi:predicted ArsR family transcriptional regulator
LLQLQREGWIESRVARGDERGRTGRPATRYNLTEAGDHLFPKSYDLLNVAVIDAVAQELGPDAAVRVLKRVCDDRVAIEEKTLQGLPLESRVEALKGLYAPADPYMTSEKVDDGFLLVERNCPFFNTAMRRPTLCSVSVNALTRLLGVRVERDETFQSGAGRCVFHIYSNEPIDAKEWDFTRRVFSASPRLRVKPYLSSAITELPNSTARREANSVTALFTYSLLRH